MFNGSKIFPPQRNFLLVKQSIPGYFRQHEYFHPDRRGCFEDIFFCGELFSWNCDASKDIFGCGEISSSKRMFFQDECFILRGICGYFPPGFLMRVILCGKWGVFYAWIAAAVDSARVLLLFSAWILFVAGLERDFKCFSARIVAAGDSARVLGHFPACRRANVTVYTQKIPCTQKKYPRLPKRKGKKKSQPHF